MKFFLLLALISGGATGTRLRLTEAFAESFIPSSGAAANNNNGTGTGITCDKCQSMLSKVENLMYLANDYSKFICTVVPEAEKAPCLEMAETITPYVMIQIIENYEPATVCQRLGYCKKSWWLF